MKAAYNVDARNRALRERQRRAAHAKVVESIVALWNQFAEENGSFADDHYRRRVVVPLVTKSSIGKVANPRFNPTFRI